MVKYKVESWVEELVKIVDSNNLKCSDCGETDIRILKDISGKVYHVFCDSCNKYYTRKKGYKVNIGWYQGQK